MRIVPAESEAPKTSLDPDEIARFEALAKQWWDPSGKFKPLHKFNPVRLGYIRDQACAHFERDPKSEKPFQGLRILDIGCGGGLLCEPMARLGAEIVGADPGRANIEVAKIHAEQSGLTVDYRLASAEELAAAGERFDIVLNMEVVEHVLDVDTFMDACSEMVRPGGLKFVATLNRTAKSYALAIIGAEYVLRWLPRGTHDWKKFLKPEEIEQRTSRHKLTRKDLTGVSYSPLTDQWSLARDTGVNYMLLLEKVRG